MNNQLLLFQGVISLDTAVTPKGGEWRKTNTERQEPSWPAAEGDGSPQPTTKFDPLNTALFKLREILVKYDLLGGNTNYRTLGGLENIISARRTLKPGDPEPALPQELSGYTIGDEQRLATILSCQHEATALARKNLAEHMLTKNREGAGKALLSIFSSGPGLPSDVVATCLNMLLDGSSNLTDVQIGALVKLSQWYGGFVGSSSSTPLTQRVSLAKGQSISSRMPNMVDGPTIDPFELQSCDALTKYARAELLGASNGQATLPLLMQPRSNVDPGETLASLLRSVGVIGASFVRIEDSNGRISMGIWFKEIVSITPRAQAVA